MRRYQTQLPPPPHPSKTGIFTGNPLVVTKLEGEGDGAMRPPKDFHADLSFGHSLKLILSIRVTEKEGLTYMKCHAS